MTQKPGSFYLRGEIALCNSESCPGTCVTQLCIYRTKRETLEKPPDHPVMTDLLVMQTAFAKRVLICGISCLSLEFLKMWNVS